MDRRRSNPLASANGLLGNIDRPAFVSTFDPAWAPRQLLCIERTRLACPAIALTKWHSHGKEVTLRLLSVNGVYHQYKQCLESSPAEALQPSLLVFLSTFWPLHRPSYAF